MTVASRTLTWCVEDEVPRTLPVTHEDDARRRLVSCLRYFCWIGPALLGPLLVSSDEHHGRASRVERELSEEDGPSDRVILMSAGDDDAKGHA